MARNRKNSQNTGGKGGVAINHPPARASSSTASSARSTLPPSTTGTSDGGKNYFAQFDGFKPNPEANFIEEFARLAIHEGWTKKEKKTRRLDAIDAEFEMHYGTNMNKLEMWQSLCQEVKIQEIPESITKCKKALKSVYVNIYNLIDHRRNPDHISVIVFQNLKMLREYTVPNRIYPLKRAKEDTFIKALLRRVGWWRR